MKTTQNLNFVGPRQQTTMVEIRPLVEYVQNEPNIFFSDFSTKTCVVGTQKNRLIETVLLSTQNRC